MGRVTGMLSKVGVACRAESTRQVEVISAGAFASTPLSSFVPVSAPAAWKNQRARQGLWWCSSIRRHVPFATLRERDAIVLVDYRRQMSAALHSPSVSYGTDCCSTNAVTLGSPLMTSTAHELSSSIRMCRRVVLRPSRSCKHQVSPSSRRRILAKRRSSFDFSRLTEVIATCSEPRATQT